jgi:hypothetical protein
MKNSNLNSSRKIKPPAQGLTDGKAVKKQQVDKLLHKKLDKPTKTVYNIRKDEAGLMYLARYSSKHDCNVKFIMGAINLYNDYVVDICNQAGIPKPVLAGGALRDLAFNKHPKDYDYFFCCNDADEAYELIDKLLLTLGPEGFKEGGPNSDYEEVEAEFEGVYGVFMPTEEKQVQFIVKVEPPMNFVYEGFDLSICQA